MSADPYPNPTFAERAAAFSNFLGLGAFWWRRRGRQSQFVLHHLEQSLAVFFMLLIVAAMFTVAVLVISYTMVNARSFYEDIRVEAHLMSLVRKAFLCWLVFWGFGAMLAALGSWREMPLVHRIARRPKLLSMAAMAQAVLAAILLLCGAVAFHASTMMRAEGPPGKVYFLYEDVDKFPRAVFLLGHYRMAIAGKECFGEGETLLLELTRENILRGLSEATFLFVGSHGTKKGLMVDGGFFTVDDIPPGHIGSDLSFVYMTGCDQKAPWVKSLAPAQVITFDRLTAVVEHIWWMWMRGPDEICRVAREYLAER